MSKRIPLPHNKFCLVDDEDFDYVNKRKWCIKRNGQRYGKYVARTVRIGKKCTTERLHRYIMSLDNNHIEDMEIDHINRNTLDNRKCNLRIVTKAENLKNRKFN